MSVRVIVSCRLAHCLIFLVIQKSARPQTWIDIEQLLAVCEKMEERKDEWARVSV
jgi:hypothetical protein